MSRVGELANKILLHSTVLQLTIGGGSDSDGSSFTTGGPPRPLIMRWRWPECWVRVCSLICTNGADVVLVTMNYLVLTTTDDKPQTMVVWEARSKSM